MKSSYSLKVTLENKDGNEVFNNTYRIAIWDTLVLDRPDKEHSFAGYVRGLVTQLKLNSLKLEKMDLKKWQIYAVNF